MALFPEPLECDYLVIGAGAMGMAFTDELLARTKDYKVLVVDKRGQPGGHWNDAYPYVRLHQPSCFYGVNSMKLERSAPRRDFNNELASGAEVVAYFQRVLESWKGSGRVQYLPMCEVDATGYRVTSLVEPERTREVRVRRKVVDSTYMKVEVPATKEPAYRIAPGTLVVPPNRLPSIAAPSAKYVVIGAGKTGIDAVVWLLRHGAAPERLSWVMPRDAWLMNRRWVQPGSMVRRMEEVTDIALRSADVLAQGQEEIMAEAYKLERSGILLRVDEGRWPEAFQCATVDEEELGELRRVLPGIVRLGYVREVGVDSLLLDGGELATGAGTLHVDCTADALARRPAVPIFSKDRITLQPVTLCQQVAGAALLAYVESRWPEDEAKKNQIVKPCPHPNGFKDMLTSQQTAEQNFQRLGANGCGGWFLFSRLSSISHEPKLGLAMAALRQAFSRRGKPQAKL